jgi:D-alanine--poly(phosphoribitol) ligase subunit 2
MVMLNDKENGEMSRTELIDYMEKRFLFEFDEDITETTDLFKAGIIDSFGYIELMKFVQDRFQIHLSRSELLSNVITTLQGIVALVDAKRGAQR